jgi:high-affinity Fe2+/Pb2+ permease
MRDACSPRSALILAIWLRVAYVAGVVMFVYLVRSWIRQATHLDDGLFMVIAAYLRWKISTSKTSTIALLISAESEILQKTSPNVRIRL